MYAVIMAGGSGTRFWPESRSKRPKQVLNIVDSENTMMQMTVNRVLPVVPNENIFIVTNVLHKDEISRQLPDIDSKNIIAEPVGRNTAPCIGLAALHIKRSDPDGVMAVLSADHHIKDEKLFLDVLKSAEEYVMEKKALVTLGIKAVSPETGYGYIQKGEKVADFCGNSIYNVQKFTEKPDRNTAQSFVDSGEYFWNCGVFVWKADTILNNIKRYLPETYNGLMEIDKALDQYDSTSVVEKVYSGMESVSIDCGVLEKAEDVAIIPCDPGWSDVGSWNALYDLLDADSNGNITLGKEIVSIDTTGTFIKSEKKLVAAIGLKDLIIVETDDALLVCPKDRSQDVKEIVSLLKSKEKLKKYT